MRVCTAKLISQRKYKCKKYNKESPLPFDPFHIKTRLLWKKISNAERKQTSTCIFSMNMCTYANIYACMSIHTYVCTYTIGMNVVYLSSIRVNVYFNITPHIFSPPTPLISTVFLIHHISSSVNKTSNTRTHTHTFSLQV